jgi:hypothetical protein
MIQKENKTWKYLGLIIVAYLILWFCGPMFNRSRDVNVMYQPMPDYYPKPTPYQAGPTYKYDSVYNHDSNPQNDEPVTNPNPQVKVEIIPNHTNDDGAVACTMDAKICADGSAVGREGPNCEFAKCPDEK